MTVRWRDVPHHDWIALQAQLRGLVAQMEAQGTYTDPLRLAGHYLWVDSSTRLRIKATAPTSDTDGTVVGTQT